MPRKKSNLNNASTREARRKRIKRAHQPTSPSLATATRGRSECLTALKLNAWTFHIQTIFNMSFLDQDDIKNEIIQEELDIEEFILKTEVIEDIAEPQENARNHETNINIVELFRSPTNYMENNVRHKDVVTPKEDNYMFKPHTKKDYNGRLCENKFDSKVTLEDYVIETHILDNKGKIERTLLNAKSNDREIEKNIFEDENISSNDSTRKEKVENYHDGDEPVMNEDEDEPMMNDEMSFNDSKTKDTFSDDNSSEPSRIEKKLKCNYCRKHFFRKTSLIAHLKEHCDKIYKCEYCVESFTQSKEMTKHLRTHSKCKPYKCNKCSKCFYQLCHLKRHSKIHSGNKLHKCDHCGKRFTRVDILIKHLRIHTGEKPFECKICNKTFTQQVNLTKHIRIHTGEKPYKCMFCDKSCSQSGDLKKHLKVHNYIKDFKCINCNKCFKDRSSLLTHNKRKHML